MRLTARQTTEVLILMSEVLVLAVLRAFKLERRMHDREMMAYRARTDESSILQEAASPGLVPLLNGVAAPGTMGPWVCHSWE